jgi:hypothetical protein
MAAQHELSGATLRGKTTPISACTSPLRKELLELMLQPPHFVFKLAAFCGHRYLPQVLLGIRSRKFMVLLGSRGGTRERPGLWPSDGAVGRERGGRDSDATGNHLEEG